jgi:hypothetical protein
MVVVNKNYWRKYNMSYLRNTSHINLALIKLVLFVSQFLKDNATANKEVLKQLHVWLEMKK